MKILITGIAGFMGRNLAAELENIRDGKAKREGLGAEIALLGVDLDTDPALLDRYCAESDFVFHLAGVNRPADPSEFVTGNVGLTARLLELLEKHENPCPVMLASSAQAALDNAYGRSKRGGEELLMAHARRSGSKALIYRFPNVFGKWSRPDYNSAVATFCHRIARGLPITVNDPDAVLTLVYIDDVVNELVEALAGREHREGAYCAVPVTYQRSLGQITELLRAFEDGRENLFVPVLSDGFTRKLYATWLSFLPEDRWAFPLKMNTDARGSFTEMLRTPERGQVSVNITRPGVTKGNHWHHSKSEKFIVVSGFGVIRFRKADAAPQGGAHPLIEVPVNGESLQAVEIPPGYTHHIENLSDSEDLITVMWASEAFDPEHPDTFYLKV